MKTRKKNKEHMSTFLYLNHYGVALYCKTVQIVPPPPVLPRFPHVFFSFLTRSSLQELFTWDLHPIFRAKGRRHIRTDYLIIRKHNKDDRKYQKEHINRQSRTGSNSQLTEIYGKGKTTISKYKCQTKVKKS